MEYDYKTLLNVKRARASTSAKDSNVEEFYSDRSRIVYCSSFRRLQQKAQVFSLEPNSGVRTRLTHSIEVSDLGRTMANKIGYKLRNAGIIEETTIPMMVAVVENACLLHDIGNPPFGHFCEAAIQEWAGAELDGLAKQAGVIRDDENALQDYASQLYKLLTADFREFDGNPQGFRLVTKLHCEQDEYALNLTYATLLCSLKYARAAGEPAGNGALRKAGYFQSEKDLAEKIRSIAGLEKGCRYPLSYILEMADDLAYCLSDISDGIEKKIIKPADFLNELKLCWQEYYGDQDFPVDMPEKVNCFSLDVSVRWSRKIMEAAVTHYMDNHEMFFRGFAGNLMQGNAMDGLLNVIKKVSRKLVYQSAEAEKVELTGYAVIKGLLGYFGRLLRLPYKHFITFLEQDRANGFELEWRLYNRLSRRYVKCYQMEVSRLKKESLDFSIKEWWLRTHLIIDHISGMTDGYALATYQMLTGIRVPFQ